MTTTAATSTAARRGAASGAVRRGAATMGGAARLLARSFFPLLRTLLAVAALVALLTVPLWIWSNIAVRSVDVSNVDELVNGGLNKLMAMLVVPALAVVLVVALSALGAVVIVLDDVAEGRRPHAVRAVARGVRSVPRLLVTTVPAVIAVAILLIAAPVVMIVGVALALVTTIGRRRRPDRHWPSGRVLRTMVIPFGAAMAVAARWLVLPAVVVLERRGRRASFRRTRSITAPRLGTLAAVMVGITVVVAAVVSLSSLLLSARDAAQTTHDLASAGIEGAALVLLAAIVVRTFVDSGGEAVPPPPPVPPRVGLAVTIAIAMVAALAPMLIAAPPAHASVPGATFVVNDLGDGDDATVGDSTCATATSTCTLRAALEEANVSTGDSIGFSVSGTITVGSELVVSQPMTIDGSGAKVTVSGGNAIRVFRIQGESTPITGAIRNLTVADGTDPNTGGGAIFDSGPTTGFTLENLTVRNNSVPATAAFGGAVMNFSDLAIVNSTFVGNTTGTTNAADLDNRFGGTLTVSQSTFTGSTGTVSVSSAGTSLAVNNSIIAAPASATACSGTITGAGNVSTDPSVGCPGATATATQLALQPLADNGGASQTVRLGPSSAAIDAGQAAGCPATDQRGSTRPKGAACDAGAYEFDPATTTTLTATPNPSAFGTAVSLHATVAAASEAGAPTGTVRFLDGATTLGTVALVGGAASLSSSTLATGPHSLTAKYLPDTKFVTSTSSAVNQTVNASTTTVSITSSGSPSIGGTAVTFTITAVSPGSTPTGSVTLLDGTTSLTTKPLDGTGRATYTTSSLTAGHHVLTASYSGDPGHGSATSSPFNHDVVSASTTTLSGPPGPTVFGNGAAFDVLVVPTVGGVTPTGTVTLLDGGVSHGSPLSLDASGRATITVTDLAPGTHTVTVAYAGDSFNNASTSNSVSPVVTNAATSTALTVTPSGPSVYGTAVMLQATVASTNSSARPTGSVAIFDGTTAVGSGAIDATGVTSLNLSSLAVGAHTFRVDFTGGTGFDSSSSPSVAHTVTAANTTTGLAATPSSSTHGESVTLHATVSNASSSAVPAGTVTFRDGTTVLGTATLDGSGQASVTTTAIAVGSRTLIADYGGNANFAVSSSPGLAHTVTPGGVTVQMTDAPDPSVFGGTVALNVAVTAVAPSQGVPTGTATVREGATVLATLTLDGTGHASTTLGTLAVGPHTLTTDYAGDGNFSAGSTSAAHTVAADTATVDLVSSAPSSAYTQPVTFTATVTGTGSRVPTGTVTFHDGSTVLGAATLDSNGVARITVATIRFGTYLVTADYSGDAGFGAATDAITQDVSATGTSVTLTATPSAPTVDDVVTLTAAVTAVTTSQLPTGSVTFYDDTVALTTVAVDANGQATFSQPFSRAVHPVTARFTGTPGWAASASGTVTITPARAPSTITVSGSPNPVGVGGNVTWTATFARSPAGPPETGSVQFWSGTTSLGTATISGGVASLLVAAPNTVGPWAVFATYDGDLNHDQGTSPTASIAVSAAGTSTTAVVPASSYTASDIALRANVTSTAAAPVTGSVRFTADSPGFTPLTATVDSTGWAQVIVSNVPAGSFTVTTEFQPSAGSPFGASTATAPLVVQRRPASVALDAPSPVLAGARFDVSFSVTDLTSTGPSPQGTVTVSGGGVSCSATVSAGRCALSLSTGGPVSLSAAYDGDAVYQPATSNAVIVTTRGGTSTLTAWSTTPTWITGDPINITWRLQGPTTGEVVVNTPTGEACRSTVLDLGSCTVTLPFDTRGQTVPVTVVYAGDAAWSPASADVSQPMVGCYHVTFDVIPADAGTITPPAASCDGRYGYPAGTRVSVQVRPRSPYQLDHWLEDGSVTSAYSFIVGEDAHSATALMTGDCKQISVVPGEQIDSGPAHPRGGTIDLSPAPNCPGRPDVVRDPQSGRVTGWYQRNMGVAVTGTPLHPETDELKGFLRDDVLTRQSTALTVVLDQDVALEARFGVKCARPTFSGADDQGTVQPFTASNCIDAIGDGGWQQGSRVGVRVAAPDHDWIKDFGANPPVDQTTFARAGQPDDLRSESTAYWDATNGLDVVVDFDGCKQLALDPQGPGHLEAVTSPNCGTRPASDGAYFMPDSQVELKAVPDPPHLTVTQIPDGHGGWQNYRLNVVPEFLDWSGVDYDGDPTPTNPAGDPHQGFVVMGADRTVGGTFYDKGRCMPFEHSVVPDGAAQLDVKIQNDPGGCPPGEADLADVKTATFVATPNTPDPQVGWQITTTDDRTDETIHPQIANDGKPVFIKNGTRATAYVCGSIQPEVTLIAPDGYRTTGPAPDDTQFVAADTDPNCPLSENAYTVGSQIQVIAGAPDVGYEFDHWEGDVSGTDLAAPLTIDGSKPTFTVRAVYTVRCVKLTVEPGAKQPDVGPKPNCPHDPAGPDPSSGNTYSYIGGTPVMLDAKYWSDHDFTGWSGEGVLDRDAMVQAFTNAGLSDMVDLAKAMDRPAMVNVDFDMTVTATYQKHSVGKIIVDGLATLGKKTIGILSLLTIGSFETFGLGWARLAVSAAGFLTKVIDPSNKGAQDLIDGINQKYDLMELTLLCTADWAKGNQKTNPANPSVLDDLNRRTVDTHQDLITGGAKVASKGMSLNDAVDRYRIASSTPDDAARWKQKIRPDDVNPTLYSKKAAVRGLIKSSLGTALAVGTAIYSFVADGPGVIWEDTAQQAWADGQQQFQDCVQTQLHEAFPDQIPAPGGQPPSTDPS